MDNAKSWFSSGGSLFLLGGMWLFLWLLGFTNVTSPSLWMLGLAVYFFILGMWQTVRWRRRNSSG